MKKNSYYLFAMMMVMLSVGFISCGGDDNDNLSNTPSLPEEPDEDDESNGSSTYDFTVPNVDGVIIYYKYIKNKTELAVSYDYRITANYAGKVVIPSSVTYKGKTYKVTSIGEAAFRQCKDLISVTIPNSITSIGLSAFVYCSGLTSVTIPNSVISISNTAFAECSGLTSITIGSGVTSIGSRAFDECTSLISLYSLNVTPPYAYTNNFTANQYKTLNVYVPQEALSAYQRTEPWKSFEKLRSF